MPVPKRKVSRQRRDKRKANKGLKMFTVASCLTCSAPVTPHTLCTSCGYYKGKKVLRTKTDRMHARGQARQQGAKTAQPLAPSESSEQTS